MTKVRNSNPCDGCTIRRVKCEVRRPCTECRERGIECTVLRTRKKRGPKGGPRAATRSRVEEYQRSLQKTGIGEASASRSPRGSSSRADGNCSGSDENQDGPSSRRQGRSSSPVPDLERRQSRNCQRSSSPERIPIHAYRRVLLVYRKRAYSIWPVIRANDLLERLERNELDYESYALAAACCAATIANLRMPEHGCGADSNGAASSGHPSGERFLREALRMRERYDYRESASLAAALTAFFIHIHYVNLSPAKPRSASHYLREAITFVHVLRLGEPELEGHRSWNADERSLRVLVYWLILLSERTFTANGVLPPVLQVIDALPDPGFNLDEGGEGGDGDLIVAFTALTRLFGYVDTSLLGASSSSTSPILDRGRLVAYQAALCRNMTAAHESQRVDLFVTRQWVRLILWEYATRHFPMASHAQDLAFSLYLPVSVSHELLGHLSSVSTDGSIRPHGFSMELKVSRAADALMDIIAVVPSSARGNGMLLGSGDVLAALRGVLFEVGGPQSAFLWRMDMRMEQLGIFPQAWSYRMLPSHIVEDVTGDEDAGDQDTGHAEWETGSTTQLLC